MTAKFGNVVVIAPEAPAECEFCHQVEELRPCGPKGERLCFPCGQRDPEALERYATKLPEECFPKRLSSDWTWLNVATVGIFMVCVAYMAGALFRSLRA